MTDNKKAYPYAGTPSSSGMDLRDFFASQIITGLMVRNWSHIESDSERISIWVKSSYFIADLMMEERKNVETDKTGKSDI